MEQEPVVRGGSGPAGQDLAEMGTDAASRGEIARQLAATVRHGWEVSTARAWLPAGSQEILHPDVMVHRPLDRVGGLPVPPVLCVTITAGPQDRRTARAYARFGVDHYWHYDSRAGVLEVSVRVDDQYRRAETLTITDTAQWLDFGIGVVRLTLNSAQPPLVEPSALPRRPELA